MKLRTKKQSDLIAELTLPCGMIVVVRRLTRQQLRDLAELCSVETFSRRTGRTEKNVDDAKWGDAAPDAYIAGWRNFQPSMCDALGLELEEAPVTTAEQQNGSGEVPCIPYSQDLARQLWAEANPDEFTNRITECSEKILQAQALLKKSASTTSAASPS